MTDMSRIEQRERLFTELGLLVDPIRRLIVSDPDPIPKIPYVRSQFSRDLATFQEEVRAFCKIGELYFKSEFTDVRHALERFMGCLPILEDAVRSGEAARMDHAIHEFETCLEFARMKIRRIPCEDADEIFPGESPLRTFLRLRAICSAAGERVQVFDPYLDIAPFHRYLSGVAEHVQITVVTHEGIMAPVLSDKKRVAHRDRIVAVSELFAIERPDSYRFLVTPQQHDRHLRVDQSIYHLGGSMKDAAKEDPYTVGRLDPTQSNHSFLDDVIALATEWYGPSTRRHRRE